MEEKKLKGVWKGMQNRCYNERQKSYPNYGGRGVVLADRWLGAHGFVNFIRDMGPRPEGATIERVDNDGPYSPDNCRWATRTEQSHNKRNNRWITANGETKCLVDWAQALGCKPPTILKRIEYGWTEEAAVTTPVPDHPNAKLCMDDARYVRNTYPTMTAQALAVKLGVCKKTILNIIHNKTFKG